MTLALAPIDFKDAAAFVGLNHRHHNPPVGWKFGIAVMDGERLAGVVMVGRPVARHADDGFTLEVLRCCTDGVKNGCSFLYAAAWRVAKNLGYRRLITYTLPQEGGSSLRASGWRELYQTPGRSWSVPSRPRVDSHPLGPKTLWEITDEAQAG